jgi:cytochrome P450
MTSNSNLVAFIAVAWIAYCIYRFTKTRLEYRNLPGPPHSFIFGHLPAYVKMAKEFPRDAHSNITLNALANEHNLVDPGCFYVDAYPIRNDRQLIITSPEVAAQVVKADKHPFISNVFGSVLGRNTMAVSNGSTWKSMRATFAASFAPSNLLSMMPAILDESELFVNVLTNAASKDGGYVGSLSHMIQTLSFDLVCRLVLGKRMLSQIKECELADLLHAAAELPKPASLNPLESINVFRISAQRRYERVTKEVIDEMILERWYEVKKIIDKPESQQSRFIIDMALKAALRSGNLTANQDRLPQSLIDLLSDK